MLFILIPLVWLAVAALVVAACQTASRAERGDGDARREERAAGGTSALRVDLRGGPLPSGGRGPPNRAAARARPRTRARRSRASRSRAAEAGRRPPRRGSPLSPRRPRGRRPRACAYPRPEAASRRRRRTCPRRG